MSRHGRSGNAARMGKLLLGATLALGAGLVGGACDSSDAPVAGIPTAGGDIDDFDPGTKEPEGSACGEVEVTFQKRIPYVMLLVDQSGSMTADFGNGTRWNVLQNQLLDPTDGIVRKLENEVRFGLALYTSHEGNAGGACPLINSVDAQFGNYQQIKAAYDSAQPDEDTPTGESLMAVAEQLNKIYLNVPTPKVIVLATDGEPDTCDEPDPQNGQQKSIDSAKAAYQMGIETYIVSVGDEVGLPHLQDMANAGAGLQVGGNNKAQFWQALDQNELYDAFDTIINGVRDCVFTLDGNVVDGYENQGTVMLDGQSLSKDDPNGWRLNGSNEVQLLGTACETIQDGEHQLAIDFPCGGYEAPPIF
jgi:hypothetical protein